MATHVTRIEALVFTLIEVAAELDKGEYADIGWLKYQGDMIREAAAIVHYNYSEAPMPTYDVPLTF